MVNNQLRKARTMGMNYPRAAIIGQKHPVSPKCHYLRAWIEKNPPNNQSEEKAVE